jgi:hypothetical protein
VSEVELTVPFYSCPQCGSGICLEDQIAEQGDLLSFRCRSCGNVSQLMVARAPSLEPITKWYSLKMHWQRGDEPSPQEMQALRKLHEGFRDMPVEDLKWRLQRKEFMEFGRYSHSKALEIQERARQMGLNLLIHKLPQP